MKKIDLVDNIFLPINLLLNHHEKTLFIKSHLGTRKTSRYTEYIYWAFKNKMSILILSPRVSFAYSFVGGIKKLIDIDITIYKDKTGQLSDNYLICQIESLNRINKFNWDVVICDEIEGILKRFDSLETHNGKFFNNYFIFEQIIQDAKNLICADSFLSNSSINTINKLRGNIENKVIINNENPYTRTAYKVSNIGKFQNLISNDFNNNNIIY